MHNSSRYQNVFPFGILNFVVAGERLLRWVVPGYNPIFDYENDHRKIPPETERFNFPETA